MKTSQRAVKKQFDHKNLGGMHRFVGSWLTLLSDYKCEGIHTIFFLVSW